MLQSHEYRFQRADLGRMLGLPLLVLASFALLMFAGSRGGLLPDPCPALDLDRTILLHQAEASRHTNGARILLIGDSSCLMGVSANALTERLGEPVLNLATLSYVDLPTHAKLISGFLTANRRTNGTVILLMHPESLRLPRRNEYFSRLIHSYLAREDFGPPLANLLPQLLGAEIFRGRVLARAIPSPLPGAYGPYYGFTHDLWEYMSAQNGSAIDPRKYAPQGSAEYRLAQQLKEPSEQFRARFPAGTRLLVGLTPSPQGFVLPNHQDACARILAEWAGWLRADGTLALPFTMPESLFASTTHLNSEGVREYTALLGSALRSSMR